MENGETGTHAVCDEGILYEDHLEGIDEDDIGLLDRMYIINKKLNDVDWIFTYNNRHDINGLPDEYFPLPNRGCKGTDMENIWEWYRCFVRDCFVKELTEGSGLEIEVNSKLWSYIDKLFSIQESDIVFEDRKIRINTHISFHLTKNKEEGLEKYKELWDKMEQSTENWIDRIIENKGKDDLKLR